MAEKPTAAEWLELLAEKAPELRKAGVARIELEGCLVQFAPEQPDLVPLRPREQDLTDPLDDPDLYGGQVPTLSRRRAEQ